ncbi:ABC transporter substrate-binding protein [Pseudooceanicola sp. GBMRC 2024]|uniref:ABC transporter substrate-binding protein n=1 Tax=Pseudooceanicola albus TaxID=2692189 RepID=A0A6L7G1F8_9RHOB|nr:ABC transporter substrate-binding protein [Pseudooceanicola albus]MXN17885.1 ABC transporter substrate-binding protein [Pseudooceanicola albus]
MTSPSDVSRRKVLAGLAALPATAGLFGSGIMPTLAQAQEGSVVTLMGVTEAPALLSFVNTSSLIWSAHCTEGLLEFDYDMNPQPLLATEWNVSDDGLVYTFKLRQGVKWHDGEDFSAKDVKFSIETSAKYHSRNRSTFSKIEAIETPDDYTVILRLSAPTPFLLKAFSSMESPIVPSHLYADGQDPLTHPNNTAPIGTGAYVFKKWERGSYVMWEKNPNYWNPDLPKIDRLVAKFVLDASARTIAFETGDVDIGYRTPIPFRDIDRVKTLPNLAFTSDGYQYDPPNIIIVEANLRDETLKDLKVRQAIAHCIDREMINRVVFFKYATPSPTPVVPYHKAFHLDDPSPYGYDIDKAKALLKEAGHPDGITLTMEYVGDDQRVLGEFLRAALSRAGIKIELRGQDMGTLIKRVYGDQAYQLHLASISNLFDPQVGVQRLYWSKNIIKGVGFSNGTGYSNPDVDSWLEAAAVSNDQAERVELWKKVQKKVMEDVPSFPLVMAAWQTLANTRVADHTTNAEGYEGSMARMHIVG